MAASSQLAKDDQELLRKFNIITTLNKGEFADTKLALTGKGAVPVVLKISGNNQFGESKEQMEFLQTIAHRNLACIYEVISNATYSCTVVEYLKGGSLRDLLNIVTLFGDKGVRDVFTQALSGLRYLHKKYIPHGDICLENMMLDNYGTIKLVDFWHGLEGFCARKEIKLKSGKLEYYPPEVLRNRNFDLYKVDVWSMGVVLYLLSTGGYYPYSEATPDNMLALIGTHDLYHNFKLAPSLQKLVGSLMSPDPCQRPDTDEIINHQWILAGNNHDQQKEENKPPKEPAHPELDVHYEKEPLYLHLLENPEQDMFVESAKQDVSTPLIVHEKNKKESMYRLICHENKETVIDVVEKAMIQQGHKYTKLTPFCFEARHRCQTNFTRFQWRVEAYKIVGLPMVSLNFFFIDGSTSSFQEKISIMKELIRNTLHVARDNDYQRSRPHLGDDKDDFFFDVENLNRDLGNDLD